MVCREFTRFLITLGYVLFLPFLPALSVAASSNPMALADELLESADLNLPQVRTALKLYEEARPGTQAEHRSLLIRLARVSYLAGEMAEKGQRQEYYRLGQDYAEQLLREQPRSVEGHYWLALNLCGQADSNRNLQSLRLLPRIMEELQAALALDETYDQAGPHRVLGRIYYEAPGWPMSVGDPEKSRRHLSTAVHLAPENSTNHLYLAETLMKLQHYHQAHVELNLVLSSTRHAHWPQELEKDRQKALHLLQECRYLWGQSPQLPASPAS
jgi:tetratricopeptide (TPR) repeat protein